jgi:CheY-like chemotaxis protein
MPAPTQTRDLLLVDDHPIILLAVKSLIEKKLPDYRLHSAASRSEALVVAESVKPELALVDLTLPDGDGLRLYVWRVARGRVSSDQQAWIHGTRMPDFGSSTSTSSHEVPRSGRNPATSVVSSRIPATCATAAVTV